ncbi:MAG: MarR family transcriptional regulator [Chloroflexota bacterium]|nr:MarR family transcriptional regulator [Chloroflexota bacterium]
MDGTEKFSALTKKLTHVMAVEFDRRLKVHNITLAQWGILRQLWEREGRSQVELQERLSLEGASVSALLQRMIRAGLVQRSPDPSDKRVQRVFLTAQGRDLEPVVTHIAEEVNAHALEGFTADEQVFVMRLLTRALHNFGNW